MKKVRNIKERICALILAVLLPLTSVLPGAAVTVQAAETEHTISFYVYEEYTDAQSQEQKLPLSGAEVTLKVTDSGSSNDYKGTTDKDGKVTLKATFDSVTATGTYEISKTGFETVSDQEINLTSDYSSTPKEQALNMSDIQVSSETVNLEYGTGSNDTATVTIQNEVVNTAENEFGYTWTSAEPTVATVNSDGTITAVGKGMTTVIVSRNGVEKEINVTVKQKLSDMKLTVNPETGTNLTAQTDVDFTLTGMPAEADKTVALYQNDKPIGSITKSNNEWKTTIQDLDLKGSVTFKAVYPSDDENYYLETSVSTEGLSYKQQADLTLTEATKTVTYGDNNNSGEINTNDSEKSRTLKFESSDPEVVTVDNSGTYTIHKAGNATITVTAEENSEYTEAETTYELTVNQKDISIESGDVQWDEASKVYDGTDVITLTGRVIGTGAVSNSGVVGDDELIITAEVKLGRADASDSAYTSATITAVKAADVTAAPVNGSYNITLDESTLATDAQLNDVLSVTIKPRDVYLQAQLKADVNDANIQYGDTTEDAINELTVDSFEVALAGENGKIDSDTDDQGVLEADISAITEMLSGDEPQATVMADYNSVEDYYVGAYTIVKVNIPDDKSSWGNYTLKFSDENTYKGTINVVQEITTDAEIWNSINVNKLTGDQSSSPYSDSTGALWAMEGDQLSFAMKSSEKYDTVNVSQGENGGYNSTYKVPEGTEDIWDLNNAIYLQNTADDDTRTTSSDNETNKDNVIPAGKIRIDAALPTVDFTQLGGSAVDPLAENYAFGGFTTFTNTAYTQILSVQDQGSGVKEAYSYLLKIYDNDGTTNIADAVKEAAGSGKTGWDSLELADGMGTVGVPETETGFYIVLVKAIDNVGNTVVYSSNGLVFELNTPSVTINVDQAPESGYYNTDVGYSIEVTDPNTEVYSGIAEITVKVTDGDQEVEGNKVDKTNTYTLTNEDLNAIKNQDADGKTSYTLSELYAKTSYEVNGKILAEDCISNTIKIEVTAKDQAGNVSDTAEAELSFDQAPYIGEDAIIYDVTEDDNCYQSRTMTIEYQYGNFDAAQAGFVITENDGKEYTLTLQDILDGESDDITAKLTSDSQGAEWEQAYHTEERTIVYEVTFGPTEKKDITYRLTPYIADKAGTRTDYAEQTFTIDNRAPVIDVKYSNNEVKNEKYFKDPRTMTITYTERNFDEELLSFNVSVNGENSTVTLAELTEMASEENAIDVGNVEVSEESEDTHILKITFGADDKDIDYGIVPYITDLADNTNSGVNYADTEHADNANAEFTVDMVAPIIDVKYTTTYTESDQNKLTSDITADISTEVQDSMYQNMDIAAQVMITERNFAGGAAFSDGEMVIDETASYVTGEAIESDELAASVANRADMANVVNNWKDTENEYQKEQIFTFAEDANYTFNLTYTDMAGNTATLDKSGEPHRFTSDESMPEATIEIEETIFDKLADMISFVFFGNQTGKDIKTTVSDDISPVKAGYYKHYPGRDAKGTFDALTEEALIALPDTSWMVFTGKDGSGDNYDANRFAETYSYTVENMEQIVPYEKIEDKAGNTIYINADGVICEDQKSAIKIDINTPAPQTEAFTVEEDDVVYDSDVDFTISVDEANDDDSVYSGIRYVRYEVRNNGVVTQSGDYNANFEDKTARVEEFSADETVDSKLNNSNNVEIFVEVEDWSGNVETLTRDLKIDITDPEISVSFDNNEVSNDKYFGTDRTMTIVYKERNINPEGLTFDFRAGDAELERLTMAELQAVAESSGLTITDGVDTQENTEVTALTDERTLTYKITFTGGSSEDMDYEIIPHIEDQAGRTADADYEDNTPAPEEFTVDKVKPTMAVEYYLVGDGEPEKINVSTDEINRLYKNQTIRAVVKITERNFSPDTENFSDEYEQVIPYFTWTTYSGTPGSVNDFETAAVSRDKWTTESEETFVRVQSFDFVADGDYSFTMEYTDLAGHELETAYDTHYFTVDKTAPEISVVYKADGQIINPGEIETERLFRNKTITADVTITERNFYRSDDAAQFEDGQMNLTYTAVDAYGETVGTSTDADAENPIENYTETANTRSEWQTGSDSGQYVRTHTFTFTKDANYTFALQYTDLAGNAAVDADDSTVTGHPAHYFTVDKTAPTGSIQIRESVWTRLFETVTFGFFTNSSDRVTFTSADKTADVATTQYYRYIPSTESRGRFSGLTVEELDRITDWRTAAPLTLNTEQQVIVYEKIVDRAGNVTYINSREGVVVDKTDADPEITITMADPVHGIYNSNVPFRISVTDPTSGGTYAGLKEVYYEVRRDGSVTQSGNYNSELTDWTQRRKSITKNEVVNAQLNNSNTVQIWVKAVDWAGNESEVTKDIKIDVTEPTIQVTYDLNSPLNDRYYNATRTATVVVTDRNFDESAVRFDITNTDGTQPSISGWSHSSNSGVSDEATHTCSVTFSADGDYTFTLNVTDLAGNDSHYTQVDDFTIDQTDPTIQVSYDNNNDAESGYYNEDRTATITVTEHNFNESEVNAQITARLQGSGVSAPGVGGWSTRGDVHTASVTFSSDADYTFDIDYTDLAGNVAADYTEDSFTIDQTAPEVEFFDIEDKSANKDTVAPGVRYSDVNYTSGGVDITIEGAIHPAEDVDGTRSNIANGESIKMADFAHTEDNDDVYTMTAVITDRAGNETEESIVFSVNRFGSTYEFSPETKAFLEDHDPEDDYTYTNDPQDIVVTERNVDTLVFNGISYGRDGTQTDLEEGSDYTVRESGSEVSWKEYMYNISRNNFEEEGHYILNIDSEDRAENSMNNKVKGLDIEFTVDKTVPTLVITGVEEDSYRADTRDMTVNVADNTAVKEVQVLVDGEVAQTYDRSQIEQMGGELTYTIQNANSPRIISAVAVDLAGNETTYSLDHEVLVTSNLLIQYVNNTPLVVGSIIAVIVIAGAAYYFLIIAKRRKKGQEK